MFVLTRSVFGRVILRDNIRIYDVGITFRLQLFRVISIQDFDLFAALNHPELNDMAIVFTEI